MIPAPRTRRLKENPDSRRSFYILGVVAICGLTLIGQMFWVARNQFRFSPFAIERIRCDACKGIGLVSMTDEQGIKRLRMCDACHGLGNRQIRRVDEHDLLCPACTGFGRVEDEQGWRWCRRCDGRGLMRHVGTPPPTYQPPAPVFGPQAPTNETPPTPDADGETWDIRHPASNTEHRSRNTGP